MSDKESKIDIYGNAVKIIKISNIIDELVEQLEDATTDKAQTFADYDRAIAIASAKIKNGLITEIEDFDGSKIPISSSPANLIPLYAKGICYQEAFKKIQGEAGYKALTTKIDARKAQMNGYQSINKTFN